MRSTILRVVYALVAAAFLGTAGLLLGSAVGHGDCGERMPGWGLVPAAALVGLVLGVVAIARIGPRATTVILGVGMLLLPLAVWIYIVIALGYGDEGACWSSWGAAWNDAGFCVYLVTVGFVALGALVRELGLARSRVRSGP